MPQAAQNHREHEIDVGACPALAIAAQGNIQIVPQPRRQRDVPSMPELGDAGGQVRSPEIGGQMIAQDPGGPDGHVGVTREIAIDLQAVGQHRQPRRDRAEGPRVVEDVIHEERDVVGDEDLLEQADRELPETEKSVVPVQSDVGLQLGQEDGGTDDGPGYELREESHEQGKIEEVPAGLQPAAIDIDRVAERLERVERDADRQNDPEGAGVETQRAEENLQRLDEEVEVLEEPEESEIADETDHQQHLAAVRRSRVRQSPRDGVIHDRRDDQQGGETPVPVSVEVVAGDQQQAFPDTMIPKNGHAGQHDAEEEEELHLREEHDLFPSDRRRDFPGTPESAEPAARARAHSDVRSRADHC